VSYPVLLHTAIDARDCRGLAEFYRELLGLYYRPGDEPTTDGRPDDADWLVLLDDNGSRVVTVQEKRDTAPPTWPSEDIPMQMHMDFAVATVEDLERHRQRAEKLVLGCCTTAHGTKANPSTSLPIRLGIRSACWSSRPGATHSAAADRASRRA